MSWIVEELRAKVESLRPELKIMLGRGEAQRVYSRLNQVAAEVGRKYGVEVYLNFPNQADILKPESYGTRNISFFLSEKGKKQFVTVSPETIRQKVFQIFRARLTPVGFGYEGYHVELEQGRIDIYPAALHLWCEITPPVKELLDWIFTKVYDIPNPE